GHLEAFDQDPASSPKYALLLEHFDRFSSLRSIDTPLGSAPSFTTSPLLPVGIAGQPFAATIETTGGDGARSITVVGTSLDAGLAIDSPSSGTLRISGAPQSSRKSYVLARVHDADGDPAWRVFTLETFGGAGTLVQSDFRGTSPALQLPWTSTFVRASSV